MGRLQRFFRCQPTRIRCRKRRTSRRQRSGIGLSSAVGPRWHWCPFFTGSTAPQSRRTNVLSAPRFWWSPRSVPSDCGRTTCVTGDGLESNPKARPNYSRPEDSEARRIAHMNERPPSRPTPILKCLPFARTLSTACAPATTGGAAGRLDSSSLSVAWPACPSREIEDSIQFVRAITLIKYSGRQRRSDHL